MRQPVYAVRHDPYEEGDPWYTCDWASFEDGDEVVEENCHKILGWQLGLSKHVIEDCEDDLKETWHDLKDSARRRYVASFKQFRFDEAREMFNEWYTAKQMGGEEE